MATPGTTPPPARKSGGCLSALLIIAVILGLAYGASKFFDDKNKSSSSSSSSSSSGDKDGSWNVGDCGGPDPDDAPDGYRAVDCGDSGATFKALAVMDASILPDAIQCPAGTDLIIQVKITFGSGGDKSGGIPSKTVCGRNLSGTHPGDAGAGGGQLVKGDCVTSTAQEVPCAQAAGSGYKVLDLTKDEKACPSGTTEPMRLTLAIGRPYDVICAAKA
ncbi:LppU/SCO3897 family protein [Streptomyces sp. NPDC004788]